MRSWRIESVRPVLTVPYRDQLYVVADELEAMLRQKDSATPPNSGHGTFNAPSDFSMSGEHERMNGLRSTI